MLPALLQRYGKQISWQPRVQRQQAGKPNRRQALPHKTEVPPQIKESTKKSGG